MVLNIAHRGFSGQYPENTILAFQMALQAGADGIEFDVHLSKDGVPVIIHDELLERTTNGSGLVAEHTLAQLRQLDASGPFAGQHGVNRIPTLEEYFELIRGKDILTNIELKTGVIWYDRVEQTVLELIDRFGRRDSTLISSFNHFSIVKMKELAPDIKYAFLEESRLISPAGYLQYHGIGYYHPLCYSMTQDVVQQLQQRDIRVNVWTVNDEPLMEEMLRMGVDGIITNYPDRLCAVRQLQSR